MSDVAQSASPRARAVRPPEIREHRIPTPGSKPYIAMEGFDRCLWFCESGTSKIGRFDPATAAFTEFDLPTGNATPIGITVGGDGNYWFCEKTAHQVGRITPDGTITEFRDGITPGAKPLSFSERDGALWFSEAAGNRIGCITMDGKVTE